MKIAAALLLSLIGSAARAQWWRADLETGNQDQLGLLVLICAGLAFFWVKDAFRQSPSDGMLVLLMCVAAVLGAIYLPWVRSILALLGVAFLIYGLLHRS